MLAGKQRELANRAAHTRDKAFTAAKPEVIDEVKARLLAVPVHLDHAARDGQCARARA